MGEREILNSPSGSSNMDSVIQNYSYCTFFDSGYLSRGLALIESVRSQGDQNEILVVCFDKFTQDYLESKREKLNLRLASLDDLTNQFPKLLKTKQTRSLVEFYFTSTPYVVQYSNLGKAPNHVSIYLDADLYFFGSPKVIIGDLGDSSVALIRHDYPWFLKSLEVKYGTYNVGLLAFRNNLEGKKVLDWWSEKCIEWCHDFPLDGKYADQGYLNSFAKLSKQIVELKDPGYNLAPWNTATRKPRIGSRGVEVSNSPLTFFHFHGFKRSGNSWVSSQLNYFSPLKRNVFDSIYGSYVEHLIKIEIKLEPLTPGLVLAKRDGKGLRGLIPNLVRAIFKAFSALFGQTIRDNRHQR
jgi:hypothetical protein